MIYFVLDCLLSLKSLAPTSNVHNLLHSKHQMIINNLGCGRRSAGGLKGLMTVNFVKILVGLPPVSLQMVSKGQTGSHTQRPIESLPHLRGKLQTLMRRNVLRNTMEPEHMTDKQICCL